MRALHANALRQLANFAIAQDELLLQISAFELFPCLSQRERQQILFNEWLVGNRRTADFPFNFIKRHFLFRILKQQTAHEVLQFPDIVWPWLVAEPVLRRDTEAAERQAFAVDQFVDVIAEKFGNVFRVVAQGWYTQAQRVQV